EAWVPMMLFAIVFGLSMDYEVFLLSRIKEEYDVHRDNSRAVAAGLAKTARLITAAAAIMLCVSGSFVLSDLRVLKLVGFGLALPCDGRGHGTGDGGSHQPGQGSSGRAIRSVAERAMTAVLEAGPTPAAVAPRPRTPRGWWRYLPALTIGAVGVVLAGAYFPR